MAGLLDVQHGLIPRSPLPQSIVTLTSVIVSTEGATGSLPTSTGSDASPGDPPTANSGIKKPVIILIVIGSFFALCITIVGILWIRYHRKIARSLKAPSAMVSSMHSKMSHRSKTSSQQTMLASYRDPTSSKASKHSYLPRIKEEGFGPTLDKLDFSHRYRSSGLSQVASASSQLRSSSNPPKSIRGSSPGPPPSSEILDQRLMDPFSRLAPPPVPAVPSVPAFDKDTPLVPIRGAGPSPRTTTIKVVSSDSTAAPPSILKSYPMTSISNRTGTTNTTTGTTTTSSSTSRTPTVTRSPSSSDSHENLQQQQQRRHRAGSVTKSVNHHADLPQVPERSQRSLDDGNVSLLSSVAASPSAVGSEDRLLTMPSSSTLHAAYASSIEIPPPLPKLDIHATAHTTPAPSSFSTTPTTTTMPNPVVSRERPFHHRPSTSSISSTGSGGGTRRLPALPIRVPPVPPPPQAYPSPQYHPSTSPVSVPASPIVPPPPPPSSAPTPLSTSTRLPQPPPPPPTQTHPYAYSHSQSSRAIASSSSTSIPSSSTPTSPSGPRDGGSRNATGFGGSGSGGPSSKFSVANRSNTLPTPPTHTPFSTSPSFSAPSTVPSSSATSPITAFSSSPTATANVTAATTPATSVAPSPTTTTTTTTKPGSGPGNTLGRLPRLMSVHVSFTPNASSAQSDELAVKVGDTVRVLKEYKDGWCLVQVLLPVGGSSGVNLGSSGGNGGASPGNGGNGGGPATGVVPLTCLGPRRPVVPPYSASAVNHSSSTSVDVMGGPGSSSHGHGFGGR